jgi:hypothetical protein
MQAQHGAASAANVDDAVPHSERPSRELEARSSRRTNLFVAAMLYSEGGNSPAKIRNLSEYGALVEASVLPPAGTLVRVCRGSLAVRGQIVWQRGGRAGLKFDSAIAVADWLPTGITRHQSQVDAMVHHVKTGCAAREPASPGSRPAAESVQIQLEAAAASLERMADELCSDPHVLVHHHRTLQQFEILVQRLRRICAL